MKINRYPPNREVLKLIGKGSYCKVYQLENNKIYKIYDEIYHNHNSLYYDKFLINEITNIRILSIDNNKIDYEEIDIFDNKIGIVMDNLGINLFNFINSRKKIELNLIKKIISEISRIMIDSNNKFIVHGDLKPENILIDKNYNINIIDWNLSFSVINDSSTDKYTELQTMWYRSPEQIIKEDINNYKIDVWSLGVIFIELLACNCGLFSFNNEEKLLDEFLKIFGFRSFPKRYLEKIDNINKNYENNLFISKLISFVGDNFEIRKDDHELINFIFGIFEIDNNKRFSFEDIYNHSFLNNEIIKEYNLVEKLDYYPRIDNNHNKIINEWYCKNRVRMISIIKNFFIENEFNNLHLSSAIKILDLILSKIEYDVNNIYYLISVSIYLISILSNKYLNLLYINSKINKHIFVSDSKLKKIFNEICIEFKFDFNLFTPIFYSKLLNENEKKIFEFLYIACQENNEINYLDEKIQIKLCINYIKNYFKYNEFYKKMILNNSDIYYYNLLIKSIPFSNISKIF